MRWSTSIETPGASNGNRLPPWGGKRFIADNSVWQRASKPAIAAIFGQAVRGGQIATCAVVRLEVLWSTRNLPEFDPVSRSLSALDNYPVTAAHWRAAEGAMRRLMEIGCHRSVGFPDLLIAAVAESNDLGVLHYDSDFERLEKRGIFRIHTPWAAERGTAD